MTTPAAISARFAVASHSVEVSDVAGAADPKRRFRLVPMGRIVGRDGRVFHLDDQAHAQRVVDASLATAGATQIPIDYDHQQVFAAIPGVGGTAPASGWITGLDAQADGIWADVEWTAAAAARLTAREYRYISPYFGFEPASGKLTRIVNAGLTNLPNFTELAAVASADLQGNEMTLPAIAKALGLGEDATAEQIAAAAAALKTKADSALAAASALTPDPTKFVPMAAFAELREQVAKLQGDGLEARATAAVDTAIKGGKITPAGRGHALSLFKADETAFAAFVGASPVIVSGGGLDAGAARTEVDAPATKDELAVAAMIGVSPEAYAASKKQVLGAR